jgi:hypothetical protein
MIFIFILLFNMFKHFNNNDDINNYIQYVYDEYINDLNKYDSYDYCIEMIKLLYEWIFDYIGNMNNNETDLFLIKYVILYIHIFMIKYII